MPALAAGIWGDRLSRGALFAFWVFAVYAGTACDLLVSIDQGFGHVTAVALTLIHVMLSHVTAVKFRYISVNLR